MGTNGNEGNWMSVHGYTVSKQSGSEWRQPYLFLKRAIHLHDVRVRKPPGVSDAARG